MSIKAPYNFVPLSEFIFLPEAPEQVSHDIPFSDGISGKLDIELECHTPLLIGGERTEGSRQNAGTVSFFEIDRVPVIPQTSLKGMLSGVLEVASFAKFNRVADTRYGVRDLQGKFYSQQFSQNNGSNPGWLKNDPKTGWYIQPCDMHHIPEKEILAFTKISKDDWRNDGETAPGRYQLLDRKRGPNSYSKEIHFRVVKNQEKGGPRSPDIVAKVCANTEKDHSGHLIVTGQPGKKIYDFVFYNTRSETLSISKRVFQDFMFVHKETEEWAFWKAADTQELGIPVFYLPCKRTGKVSALGLASMFKLAYKNSTHGGIRTVNPKHLGDSSFDLPELLFGRISADAEAGSNEPQNNLRGRVQISSGRTSTPGTIQYLEDLNPVVLSSPKPTYYPTYLRQKEGKPEKAYLTFMDDEARLSGTKRYPARDGYRIPTLDPRTESLATYTKMKPIPEGKVFRFSVRFHNLRPFELGALLWAIDFGERKGLRHGLGMGRPFGLGQVSLQVKEDKCRFVSNSPCSFSTKEYLAYSRYSFLRLIDRAYSSAMDGERWIASPQIKEMLAMAYPAVDPEKLKYMELDVKKDNEFVLAKQSDMLQHPHSILPDQTRAAIPTLMEDSLLDLRDGTSHSDFAQWHHQYLETLRKREQEKMRNDEEREAMSDTEREIDKLRGLFDDLAANLDRAKGKANDHLQFLRQDVPSWSPQEKTFCLDLLDTLDPGLLPDPKHIKKLRNRINNSQ